MQSNDHHRSTEGHQVAHGACLCGAVAFELELYVPSDADRTVGVCHCAACRRWTGGGPVPFLVTVPERFHVEHGQELLAHYRDQSSLIRTFCRRCGTNLYQDTGLAYFVCAGALDDLELPPMVQMRLAEKAAWAEPVPDDVTADRPLYPAGLQNGRRGIEHNHLHFHS